MSNHATPAECAEPPTPMAREFDRAAFDRSYPNVTDLVERKILLRREIARFYTRPLIPGALRRAVYERDGHRCLECGATERLSLDHVHPYSLGGEDTMQNLRTLCLSCNSRKGDRI